MDSSTITKETSKELLNAQTHIWTHIFSYHNSMALICAIELGILDTIHNHGKPMTLENLANSLAIFPTKVPSLHRLLRLLVLLLVLSNFVSMTNSIINNEELYDININSKLLLTSHPCSLAPFTLGLLDPIMTNPANILSTWFRNKDESVFHVAHGRSFWEHAGLDSHLNEYFNQAMASDVGFVSRLIVGNDDFKGMMKGVETLVDVAGGNGTLCKAIAEAYPSLKCIVFDLPHVVEGLKGNGSNLEFVAGDMFKEIPHANVVLLKWIMCGWSDSHCVKILERCKEAISSKGKIIIIDMVVDPKGNNNVEQHFNAQLLFDMESMNLTNGGKQRTEDEWKNLFFQVGFNHYKIFPILGARSVIQVCVA